MTGLLSKVTYVLIVGWSETEHKVFKNNKKGTFVPFKKQDMVQLSETYEPSES